MGIERIQRWWRRGDAQDARGFLARLARSTAGNAMVIMTAALIPLAGMVGGGIDMSRMYILKTRLQHACDAGTLAGRKTMGGGNWSYNNHYARAQAEKFFDANFESGSFGSSNLTRSFSENAGKVTGTAQATIPMTLMRVFGRTTEDISVTCDAEMRLPNTDVMFVLDTTGSMEQPQPGDSVNKIAALKTAVKCFYEIVAKIDTNATCTTGVPSGGTSDQVQIRFGFVPYSTNVNVGKLLPPGWFADSWNYQTREATYTTSTSYSFGQPAAGGGTATGTSDSSPPTNGTWTADPTRDVGPTCGWFICSCPAPNPEYSSETLGNETVSSTPTAGTQSGSTRPVTWQTTRPVSRFQWRYSNYSNGKCHYDKRPQSWTRTTSYSRTDTGTPTDTQVFSGWRYASLPVNTGLLKNGTEWKSDYSFNWPVGDSASPRAISWDGCIEERETIRATTYSPIPSDAKDLDIDTVPSSEATRWKPALPGLVYTRGDRDYGFNYDQWHYEPLNSTENYHLVTQYFCPRESRLLQQWPLGTAFDSYVDSLYPTGNTYHDIGLIWGARLMSPTGPFAAQNAKTAQGGDIERHMIFMTDGDACAQPYDYTAYGLNWFDRRQTPVANAPTGGCTFNSATLVEQVNKRTEALCTAIKNKNITLWVVAFGELHSETVTRLTNCATSGKYFTATNAAELQQTFKNIADQISQLRLTR